MDRITSRFLFLYSWKTFYIILGETEIFTDEEQKYIWSIVVANT